MKLVVDIGNTNVVVGIKYNEQWRQIWRFKTKKDAKELDYSLKLHNAMWEAGIHPDEIKTKVLSTVVPELKPQFVNILNKMNPKPLIILDQNIFNQLDIDIPSPNEIGSDLVANVLAAFHVYHQDLIIIDFGTALTFTVLNKKGEILGVNIAPGLKTAMNALGDKTSQLDSVPLEFPDNIIGKNTETAIQNGVLIGYTGLVNHMIAVLKNAVGPHYKVLITGGLWHILKDKLTAIDYVAPNLTLDGLAKLPEILTKN